MEGPVKTKQHLSALGPCVEVRFHLEGKLADAGEVPAGELGLALQGWDRLLQMTFYAEQTNLLELPKPGTSFRIAFHVERVEQGSVLVLACIYFGTRAAEGIVGGRADALAVKLFRVCGRFIKGLIRSKAEKGTLDATVDEVEAIAKDENIRVSKNREVTEDFATALNAAAANATVPLDSSAAKERLSIKGQDVDIVVDQAGRQAIRAGFDPPSLDPEADEVIEAPVKFIRINRKTGYGLFQFTRPKDESQVGMQRFHCDDRAIRRRANQYTGAFHEDTSLTVKMQRKVWEQSRKGHYWLIVGAAGAAPPDPGLFSEKRKTRKRKK